MIPRQAMLLAAGLGTRMRPLTNTTAKPLLPLGQRTLLDHALDRLAAAGVERVVVNTHWHAELVAAHLARRGGPPQTALRHETRLLDTGGAVAAALADGMLQDAPFFVVNGDSFWLDGPVPALARLAASWGDDLDGVLLLHRTFQVLSDFGGRGDFALDEWGVPRRPQELQIVPYVFAGVQLLSPRLFDGSLPEAFSMNAAWDRAMQAGRLRALVHDGLWFHLSTPEDLAQAETSLQDRATAETR
jgi:MurNAc alpha-1-phosphate uridylyltransferase